jgi:peptide/nickel transport system permease protein
MNEHKGIWKLTLERFLANKAAAASLVVIALFCLMALGADLVSWAMGIDPSSQDILNRYGPMTGANLLGTDEAGRDVLIRLVYGSRISLMVAFVSAFAAMVIGIVVGMLAGYYGGWIDSVLMRLTDALLALPLIPVLILLATLDFSKIPLIGAWVGDSSVVKMILIFVIFSWMVQARLVRSAVLSVRESEFVLAAKTVGQSDFAILAREILPNVLSPVIVSVTLNVGQNILFESALSFLGLGIQPPTPTWGNMLNNALEMIYSAPFLVIMPGFLIFLVVVSFNFLGDGLQDALDPKAIRR